MKFLKISILPFILVMIVVFILMDFGEGAIEYEVLTMEQIPESLKRDFSEMGPGGTGLFSKDGHTYAFIAVEPTESVEVMFVGDARDGIGHEVRYRVIPKNEEVPKVEVIKGRYGDFTPYLIKLEKEVGTPFGFFKEN